MDSVFISTQLKTRDFKIRSVNLGKSVVWKTFGMFIDSEGCDLDFVACKQCYHVLANHGHQTGTAALNKHKCKLANGQTILSRLVKYSSRSPHQSPRLTKML